VKLYAKTIFRMRVFAGFPLKRWSHRDRE